jgi:hypothetical protein
VRVKRSNKIRWVGVEELDSIRKAAKTTQPSLLDKLYVV